MYMPHGMVGVIKISNKPEASTGIRQASFMIGIGQHIFILKLFIAFQSQNGIVVASVILEGCGEVSSALCINSGVARKKSDVLLLLNDEKSRGGGNFGRFLEVPLDSTAVD